IADRTRVLSIMSGDGTGLADVEHALYLASATLFARKERADVTLEFIIANREQTLFKQPFLSWQRFDADRKAWVDIANVGYLVEAQKVPFPFANFPSSAQTEVVGQEGAWIVARLNVPPGKEAVLPVIRQIRGSIKTPRPPVVAADAAAVNDMSAD